MSETQAAHQGPMRPAVARVLAQAAERNPRLVVLGADGHGLAMGVRSRFPDRYIDVGIAEANLVGVAAGIARAGRGVVVGTMAPFLVRRAYEQIRNDVCNPGLDVTFIGVGGGLSYGTLGPTHHAPEDLGAFASMPNTRVFCPADPVAAAWAVQQALDWPGPAYVRLGAREDEYVHGPNDPLSVDEGLLMRSGADALAVATGVGVAAARGAARRLEDRGLSLGVLALTAIKPFPEAQVRALARDVRTVTVVEEHFAGCGLAAMTALALAGRWIGRFLVHAVEVTYPPVGDRGELLAHYGVDSAAVAAAIGATTGQEGA